jgi:hypothetical protein
MADVKISDLTDGTTPQATDYFPVARSGGFTRKLSAQSLGLPDGWVAAGETWTYASASTFTVAGVDVTAKYSKGTRIKLTQTTAKYFVVSASSFSTNTTVTITAGTDYTLANAAITSPLYSYAVNPQGYPGWFSYTPTYTGFSADPSGGEVKFNVAGSVCYLKHTPDDGTSNATGFTLTLPISAVSTSGNSPSQPVRALNNSAWGANPGLANLASGSTLSLYRDYSAAAWTNTGGKNATFYFWYQI